MTAPRSPYGVAVECEHRPDRADTDPTHVIIAGRPAATLHYGLAAVFARLAIERGGT